MSSVIDKLNAQFLRGELPEEFLFKAQGDSIDWDKVAYNTRYNSFEYTASKFHDGWQCIPGFDKVIESCIPVKTPLEEIEERQLQGLELEAVNESLECCTPSEK